MVRSCELCESPARMYCDSDQARLCWDCDFKVHSANFLVARHSRTLLCHGCQSSTPWSAAGAKLGPTVTFCEKCSGEGVEASLPEVRESVDGHAIENVDELDLDEGETAEEEEDDGEGENQVVPWSSTPPPSLPVTSSSSSEVEFLDLLSLKRNRDGFSDRCFQEDMIRQIRRRENSSAVDTTESGDDHLEKGIMIPLIDSSSAEPGLGRLAHDRTGSTKDSMVGIERDIAYGLNSPTGI